MRRNPSGQRDRILLWSNCSTRDFDTPVKRSNVCNNFKALLCALTFQTNSNAGPAFKVVSSTLRKLCVDLRGIERMIETPGAPYLLRIDSAPPNISQTFNVMPSSIWDDNSHEPRLPLLDPTIKSESHPDVAINKLARSIRKAWNESKDPEVKNTASNLLLALVLSLIDPDARFAPFKAELNAYTHGLPSSISPFKRLVDNRENCAYAWTLRLLSKLSLPPYEPHQLADLGLFIFNQYCRRFLSSGDGDCPKARSLLALRLFLGLSGYKTYYTNPRLILDSTENNSTRFDSPLRLWDAFAADQGLKKATFSQVYEAPAELLIGRHLILSCRTQGLYSNAPVGFCSVWRADDNPIDSDNTAADRNSSRLEDLQSELDVLENLSFWCQPVSGSQRNLTTAPPWPLSYRLLDVSARMRLINHHFSSRKMVNQVTDYINLIRFVRDRTLNRVLEWRLSRLLSAKSQKACFRAIFKSNEFLLHVADQVEAHEVTLTHNLPLNFMTYFLNHKPNDESITDFIKSHLIDPIQEIIKTRLGTLPCVTSMAGFNAIEVMHKLLNKCAKNLERISNFKEFDNQVEASKLVLTLCSDLSYCIFLKETFPQLNSYLARPQRHGENLENIVAKNGYHVGQQARGDVINIVPAARDNDKLFQAETFPPPKPPRRVPSQVPR